MVFNHRDFPGFEQIDYDQIELRIIAKQRRRPPWYRRILYRIWHKINKKGLYKFMYGG